MDSTITFRQEARFGLGWRIFGNVFSMIPGLIVIAVLFAGVGALAVTKSFVLFGALILCGIMLFALNLFLTPLFQANFLMPGYFPARGQGFIVQISFTPRRYSGIEGVLDDADDFGVFSVQGDYVVFQGDSTYLTVHKSDLAAVSFENAGWRASFIMGDSTRFSLKTPVSGIYQFVVHTREGNTLISANRINRAFCDYLKSAFYTPGNSY
jgi:hypothetical protein